jgi:hypothetical protein
MAVLFIEFLMALIIKVPEKLTTGMADIILCLSSGVTMLQESSMT